ncbi:MAG: BMP family protein [Spirochaetota bacterium]
MKKFLVILIVLGLLSAQVFAGGAKEAEVKKLKIALILPSGKDDMAWSQGMYEGVQAVAKELGESQVEIGLTENTPKPVDAGAAIRDYANRGFDIIIAHGSQFQNPVMEVAVDFPNKSFAYGTAFKTAENVFTYDPQAQEGAYLFGMIAAKLTKSKILGIVGPVKAGDAIKYNYGFRQGVEAVDPTVKVLESYTGSFGDTLKAKEMAGAHIDAKADILTGTAQQVVGAIQAVSEKSGIYWFSNDMDQSPLSPQHIIASQAYDWKDVVKYIITSYQKGKLGGEQIMLDLANGRVNIVFNPELKPLITPDIDTLFKETLQKIKKGELKVKLSTE